MFSRHLQVEHNMQGEHPNIANHDQKLREIEQYECKRGCNFTSTFKLQVYEHWKCHPESWRGYECEHCGYATLSALSLINHEHCRSNLEGKEIEFSLIEPTIWFCKKCLFQTKHKQCLKVHMMTHVESKDVKTWFVCDQCSYHTKYKSHLKKHKLVHTPSDQIEWFYCAECSYRAKRMSDLRSHSKVHIDPSKVEWFNCPQCSYRTKWSYGLRVHLQNLHDSQEFPYCPDDWHNCSLCSFRSLQKEHLQRHCLEEHSTVFECSTCSFKTGDKNYLRKHCMLLHVHKAYRYNCKKCSFRTIYRNSMINHLIRHIYENKMGNWFYCRYCTYKGTFKVSLIRRHLQKHKEKDLWVRKKMRVLPTAKTSQSKKRLEFGCGKCLYRTKFNIYLKSHTESHEKKPWMKCAKCSYMTKNKKVFRWHKIKHVSNINVTKHVKRAKHEMVFNKIMVKQVASILRNVLQLKKEM